MSLRFTQKSYTVNEHTVHGSISELENAVVAFFWVGEKPKLGSITVTLPDRTSSQLLGDRNEIVSRMIGERLTSQYGKLAMVSTNIPSSLGSGRELLELLKLIIGEKNE